MALRKSAIIKEGTGTLDTYMETDNSIERNLGTMSEVPPPPKSLTTKAGQDIWRRAAGQCLEVGLLQGTSIGLIENYCIQHELVLACKRDLDKNGLTVEGRSGPVKNPAFMLLQQATARFISLGARFGFTPSDAASISVPNKKEIDPFDDI